MLPGSHRRPVQATLHRHRRRPVQAMCRRRAPVTRHHRVHQTRQRLCSQLVQAGYLPLYRAPYPRPRRVWSPAARLRHCRVWLLLLHHQKTRAVYHQRCLQWHPLHCQVPVLPQSHLVTLVKVRAMYHQRCPHRRHLYCRVLVPQINLLVTLVKTRARYPVNRHH